MLIYLSLSSFRLVERATSENIHDRGSLAGTDRDRSEGQPPARPPLGWSSPNCGGLSQPAVIGGDGQTDATASKPITLPVLPAPQGFVNYAKAFDCVDHNRLWKILKEMRIPDHLPCLLRNLYAGQEATVRTGHGTTDWFQIGKGVRQGCILSPCSFNFYAEHHERLWAGRSTSWNQECQEKYQ